MERQELGEEEQQQQRAEIARVTWLTTLQQLSFGCGFNQRIAGVAWPTSLRQLRSVMTSSSSPSPNQSDRRVSRTSWCLRGRSSRVVPAAQFQHFV